MSEVQQEVDAPPKIRRCFAYIDRTNIDRTTKDLLNFSIDWEKLRVYLQDPNRQWQCDKVFIYTGAKETEVAKNIAKLTRWGYEARVRSSKPQKDTIREYQYTCGVCSNHDKLVVTLPGALKSNCDVDLTVDAMCQMPETTELLLFSGDGDFEALVVYAIEHDVKVRIISNTKRDTRGYKRFSTRLQTLLDEEILSGEKRAIFIDINDWKKSIERV